jgi:thiosulfate reductase cytochrome b subunit
MTTDSSAMEAPARAPVDDRISVHPLWLRLMHWANALAVILMILSGWRIYDATNFLHFHTPVVTTHGVEWQWGIAAPYTLGGWLGGALQWHFAAMWLLVGNALLYVVLSVVTRRFAPQFLPLSVPGVFKDLKAALTGHLSHADIRRYNYVQKAAYLFAMLDIIVLIISGCALWKSVQFAWARVLTFGYEPARYIHFTAMVLLCLFILVHVGMALLVPKTIRAMVWGR